MSLHTIEVIPLSSYRLFLRFNNGDVGEVDLSNELDGEIFHPLHNPEKFLTAYQHPIMRTVAWRDGADMAPEFLLDLMHQQTEMMAA